MKNGHLFIISLVTLLSYELAMILFGFQGVSLLKLIVTGLLWISFLVTFREFLANYSRIKKRVPYFVFVLLLLLFFWNMSSVLRSIIGRDDTVTTILGNVYTSLALLVPFAIIFGMHKSSLKTLQNYLFALLKFGIPLFFIFYVGTVGTFNDFTLHTLLLLFVPAVFLITISSFQKRMNKIIILISSVLVFYVSSQAGVRTMMIRELMLLLCFIVIFLYRRFKIKWFLYLAFVSLLTPVVLLQQGIATGISPFEKYLSFSDDDNLSTDTRTFLYNELYSDLVGNNKLLTGKGATGKYYSEYFSNFDGDASLRINVEVGVLSILLKGGLIALTLHLAILFIAVFYSFFRSNNTYVIGAGFIVLVHTMLMFIENIITYNTYNFLIWVFVGLCLSKEIRQMSDSEILGLLGQKS